MIKTREKFQRVLNGISSGRIPSSCPVSHLQTVERMLKNLDSFGLSVKSSMRKEIVK